jgi:hypothetical protein
VGGGSLGNDACLFYQQRLLAKLPNSDRSEVSKNLHDAEVSLIEGYLPTVCQDVNDAPCFVRLPWKHKTVGYERAFQVELRRPYSGGVKCASRDQFPASFWRLFESICRRSHQSKK